ncbi:MAG: hypothetical protein HGA85_05135 [Nanoarchaeota archaeon]|nr:hypothetical protein [Nanoarchaeota archaeon]
MSTQTAVRERVYAEVPLQTHTEARIQLPIPAGPCQASMNLDERLTRVIEEQPGLAMLWLTRIDQTGRYMELLDRKTGAATYLQELSYEGIDILRSTLEIYQSVKVDIPSVSLGDAASYLLANKIQCKKDLTDLGESRIEEAFRKEFTQATISYYARLSVSKLLYEAVDIIKSKAADPGKIFI